MNESHFIKGVRKMNAKRKGIVGMMMSVLVLVVLASPASGAVAYSKHCETTFIYDPPLRHEQYYDSQPWDPNQNSSQAERFWQDNDDVNISLDIELVNSAQETYDFEYTVSVHTAWPDNLDYKIIEGASQSNNQDYVNTIPLNSSEEDTRYLFIEVYNVDYGSLITVFITVRVLDGGMEQSMDDCSYYWVGAI
jgi:hypothetical protein